MYRGRSGRGIKRKKTPPERSGGVFRCRDRREPPSAWFVDRPTGAASAGKTTRRCDMNWNQVEGNWEQFKGKLQEQWGKLTNDDLDVIKGNRKQLAGRLQERYGKAQDDVERDIDGWLSRH
jgi:uncharacterized protein YjbJ (UPF0337 family)